MAEKRDKRIMTDQDRVALKFYRNLMRLWGCTPTHQLQLLGCGDTAELERWQARGLPHDALLRVSHLMGIHRALRKIFGDNPAAYAWVSSPNEALPFAGRAALELLIEGRFAEVREYLERQLSLLPETEVRPDPGTAILEAKCRRQRELLDATLAASPEELEASAEQIRAVMRELKGGGRRQRMAPPPKWDDD